MVSDHPVLPMKNTIINASVPPIRPDITEPVVTIKPDVTESIPGIKPAI